jgi:deoxyribodipyrimidine photo-lyase
MRPIIVWFRQDLRLSDNAALYHAVASGNPLIPLYILEENPNTEWQIGGAQRWWLHESLSSLAHDLQACGLKLILKQGDPQQILQDLIRQTNATGVYWNRCYEPYAINRDKMIKQDLKAQGIEVESFNSALLFEPWSIKTQQGSSFKVFTPFWKACIAAPEPLAPNPKISGARTFQGNLTTEDLKNWALKPTHPDWSTGLKQTWQPGESQAHKILDRFLSESLQGYDSRRDRPDQEGTSRLSPYLHFGEISPRQIWHAFKGLVDITRFRAELGWREFSYHLLYHFPNLPTHPFRTQFKGFPWRDDQNDLSAWQQGKTGYPVVDAGMRQLWHSGWMHNRVRMITASFLTKHLLIHWSEGAKWFWDTLVDADLASNSASWQWVAGCGADAAPFFRIFNPILQGEKFDPHGEYVRKWVPELKSLPNAYIHKPWQASEAILKSAGVELGSTYPHPIINHTLARKNALEAYKSIRNQ